jgi:hypothetical protein
MTVGFLIVYALWLAGVTPMGVWVFLAGFATTLSIGLFVTHGL